MLNGNARSDRVPLTGKVDFTMMYAAHDAFTRDLQRLTTGVEVGQTAEPAVRAGWAMFKKQLHIHHTAEDTSLWPVLRAKVTRPDDVAVLDAMVAEHARIDPQLEAVNEALAASDRGNLTESVQALTEGLTAHMLHEENAALRWSRPSSAPAAGPHSGEPSARPKAYAPARTTSHGCSTHRPRRKPKSSHYSPHQSGSSTAWYGRRSTGAPPDGRPRQRLRGTRP
jgi:hemerythrin-like domain-containing protein